ncbi:MAG TPA: ROK family protein [Verrucomicrobiae bacterium]
MSKGSQRSGESGWAVGIDVGGTKIAAGVVRFPDGAVRGFRAIPTKPERGAEPVLHDLERMVGKVIEQAGEQRGKFFGVGIGICELVDAEGELLSANCITCPASEIRFALGKFGPVKIEADVRAAALAEAIFGAGKEAKNFLYVTVGTGISCSLVIDGNPFIGARGASGTMASGPFPDVDGRVMPSLEAIASGPGLVASYNQQGGKSKTAEEVLEGAEHGNDQAMIVARRGARCLGSAIGGLINVLDPELVVVGGGLGLRRGLYRRLIVEAAREHVWWDEHRAVKIIPAKTGTAAGVIGAASRVWLHEQ